MQKQYTGLEQLKLFSKCCHEKELHEAAVKIKASNYLIKKTLTNYQKYLDEIDRNDLQIDFFDFCNGTFDFELDNE